MFRTYYYQENAGEARTANRGKGNLSTMTDDEPLQTGLIDGRPTPSIQQLSIRGLALRQYVTGWSQPPRPALMMGAWMLFMPGFLTFLLIVNIVQAITNHASLVTLAIMGVLALLYLALVTGPAISLVACGLYDLRKRPQVLGGRVVAVRHIQRRSYQAHYIQIEQPNGKRERFRVDPSMHHSACQVDTSVILSVSPALRAVLKVWSEAGEPF